MILPQLYRGSGCTVCQRACSTCRLHTSLQWARPASAASVPILTRPRTLPLERAWLCSTRRIHTMSAQLTHFELFILHVTSKFFTCMMTNSSITRSWLISPVGRSNKKEEFHTAQEPPLVSLLLIMMPSWCRLITTWYSVCSKTFLYKNPRVERNAKHVELILQSLETESIQIKIFTCRNSRVWQENQKR